MNNGLTNRGIPGFRCLIEEFVQRVKERNPVIEVSPLQEVEPRIRGTLPNKEVDLVLSSGGRGSPFDGFKKPWYSGYRKFLDHVADATLKDPLRSPALFVVCHSFEISIIHFDFAKMKERRELKVGAMPAYLTEEGRQDPLFAPFGDRLFGWEYREWQAMDLDEKRLGRGALLARESLPGKTDEGEALLACRFAPGIVGTQFHPEADREGATAYIEENAERLKGSYGEKGFQQMSEIVNNPNGLMRTYTLLIPSWLTLRFNELAPHRGWNPIDMPGEARPSRSSRLTGGLPGLRDS